MGPPSGLRSSWTPKPNAFFGFLPVLRPRRGCLPRRGPLLFSKNFPSALSFSPASPLYWVERAIPPLRKEGRTMDPDAGLIRRMNQGDDEAIEAFVRKYYPQILGYCCYHLRHRQDGEKPSPGSSPPWTGTATMARRPTTSTSSPATSAGTTSAAGRSSPWRTCPRRRPRPPTGTPAWTWKPPSGPCRRRSRPWPSSACSRSASSGRPPRSWASACPW